MIALWAFLCAAIGVLIVAFLMALGIIFLFCWFTATAFSWLPVFILWGLIIVFGTKITIDTRKEMF